MGKDEMLRTRYGEFLDLISCLAIYNGGAEEERIEHRKVPMSELLEN